MVQITKRRNLFKIDRKIERMINLVVGSESAAERIPVYNQILGNTSPKFKKLVEGMDPDNPDLEILGVSKHIMKILINYIYQTFEEAEASLPITTENVHELSFAAKKFELTDVQSLCREYLDSLEIRKENCIQLFLKTSDTTSGPFKGKCLEFVLSSLPQLLTTQAFVNLTLTQLMSIIDGGRAQEKHSENLLCAAAMSWLQHRSREILSTRVTELIDGFPSKEHKRLIVRALHESSDPKLEKSAPTLHTNLYKQECNNDTVKAATATDENCQKKDSRNNPGKSKDFSVSDKGKPIVHITPLKRPSTPSCSDQEVSVHSQPKRNKKTVSWAKNRNQTFAKPLSSTLTSEKRLARPTATGHSGCPGSEQKSKDGCKIYFLAPHKNRCQLWYYDLHSLKLKIMKTELPLGLAGLTSSSLQYHRGQIYFMGGKSPESLSTNNVYIYNLEKNAWSEMNMLHPRHDIQSVRLDNWLFAFGGRQQMRVKHGGSGAYVNSVETLDLDNDQKKVGWTDVHEKSPRSRINCGIVAFQNRIYTIGGAGSKVSGVCEVFDPKWPEKEQWKELPFELSFPRYALVAVATDNEIYVIGGKTHEASRLRTVEILREDSSGWTVCPAPELIKARAYACKTGVYCKKRNAIVVFGGDSDRHPTVEKLDLATKTWTLVCDKKLPVKENYYSVAHLPCL